MFAVSSQILNTARLVNTEDQLYELKSGVNTIGQVYNENEYPFLVHDVHGEMKAWCDMETEEGGWLVIQRKVSGGPENFYRGWADYENGFGDLNDEFWYGLKNMHCLTARDDLELRIDLKMDNGTIDTWTYQLFKVAGETDNYRLTIGQGEGTTPRDFMAHSNNRQFTTHDRDNDGYGNNCAERHNGGWWYGSCSHAYLNSPYNGASQISAHDGWKHRFYHDVQMKIRPKSCVRQNSNKCQ